MSEEDKRLYLETLAEMRELKGEIREFKEHVLERVKRLEGSEARRGRDALTAISVIIAALALLINWGRL